MAADSAIERRWNIRDAVLRWIYLHSTDTPTPNADAEAVMSELEWSGNPITPEEAKDATVYLEQRGLVKGIRTFGAGIIQPEITSLGEQYADKEISVRDSLDAHVPANTTNNSFVVHGNATGAFAVGSTNVNQRVEVSNELSDQVREFADLLLSHATEPDLNESEVRAIAAEIQQEASAGLPDKGKVRAFIGRAIAAVASSAAGTAVVSAATALLPLLA